MDLDVVNERTTAYLTVTPKDKAGKAQAPSSMDYRIDCLTTGQAVRAATSVTPGASVEIELSAADNAMQNQANAKERRRVTVTATYGVDDEVNEQYDYLVRNMSHVS